MNRIEEIARIDNEIQRCNDVLESLGQHRRVHVLNEWESRGWVVVAIVIATVWVDRGPATQRTETTERFRIAEIDYKSSIGALERPWAVGTRKKKKGEWGTQRIRLFDDWKLETPDG